jgi:hypothetical protein
MKIEITVKEEIVEYCRVNEIPDISKFINKILLQGYTIEKFGVSPYKTTEVEKIVEKEVIKEVYITDDEEVKKLSELNSKLKLEVEKLKETINNLKLSLNKKNIGNNKDIYGE